MHHYLVKPLFKLTKYVTESTDPSSDRAVGPSDGHEMSKQGLGAEQPQSHAGGLGPVLEGLGVGEVEGTRAVVHQGHDDLKHRQTDVRLLA